jgi:hypothetical protein
MPMPPSVVQREIGDERDGKRRRRKAAGAPRAVAAVVLDTLGIRGCRACTRSRREHGTLKRDQILQAARIALRHVEVVIARFVRHQVIRIHGAAEELERIVEPGH